MICVDASPHAIDHLRHILDEEGHGAALAAGQIVLLEGDFTAHADQVIAEAARRSPRRGRAIFVLDQYGYDAVTPTADSRVQCAKV